MDEEKVAVTEIPPLRWPGGSKPQPSRSFFTIDPNKPLYMALKNLDKEVAARPSIPPRIWGEDPKRRRMAETICRLLKQHLFWSTDKFIPQDPIEIIYTRLDHQDKGASRFIDELKKSVFLCEYVDVHNNSQFNVETLGDLVDYCLRLVDIWPIEAWSPDPTGKICPTFSVFYDIRRFICSRYFLKRKMVSPSAPLSTCGMDRENWQYLNEYLDKRFGKNNLLSFRFLGIFPSFWAWILLLMGLYGLMVIHYDSSWIGWWVLDMIVLNSVVVYFLSWPKWRKGLHTFRDLVEYVAAESKVKTAVK